jgi:PAS domain S-box-containing protein
LVAALVGAYCAVAAVLSGTAMTALGVLAPLAAVALLLARASARNHDRARVADALLVTLDRTGEGVSVVDQRTLRIVAATPALAALAGHPLDRLAGAGPDELAPPDEHALLQERIRLRAGGHEPPRLRTVMRRPDGEHVPVDVATTRLRFDEHDMLVSLTRDARTFVRSETSMRKPDGSTRCLEMVGDEVIGRRGAFDEQERRSADLERAHADLERLISIASHDLREPLRAISGFGDLLARESGDQLSERGAEFLSMIRQAADRMNDLLDGLSRYGKAGRGDAPAEAVDVGEALEVAVQALQERITARAATVTHDELPTVIAHPKAIAQLLEQLVDNAVKFNERPAPHVHVTAERRYSDWVLTVSDDGIGVPERERDRVFEMFRRLHPRDAYAGSGVGLAVCQRIVDRFGGRIWVDDAPDGGSAFCVLLPGVSA